MLRSCSIDSVNRVHYYVRVKILPEFDRHAAIVLLRRRVRLGPPFEVYSWLSMRGIQRLQESFRFADALCRQSQGFDGGAKASRHLLQSGQEGERNASSADDGSDDAERLGDFYGVNGILWEVVIYRRYVRAEDPARAPKRLLQRAWNEGRASNLASCP